MFCVLDKYGWTLKGVITWIGLFRSNVSRTAQLGGGHRGKLVQLYNSLWYKGYRVIGLPKAGDQGVRSRPGSRSR